MIEIIIEALDESLFESKERAETISNVSFGVRNHLAQYSEMGDDPYELSDKVNIGDADFEMAVNLVSTRDANGGITVVVGFESGKVNRFLIIPRGAEVQLYNGRHQKHPLQFPGQKASLADLKDFERLVKFARIKKSETVLPLRSSMDYTSAVFEVLERMADVS